MAEITTQADLDKDRLQIIDFWQNNSPDWPKSKYRWFYQDNPAGKAGCWLVFNEEDQIIGTMALFPRVMYVKGVKKSSCIAGDLLFAKDHRNFFSAFTLQRQIRSAAKDSDIDFLYGYPNKNAEQLMKRSGYKIIGTSIRYKKLVRTNSFLKSKLKNRLLSHLISKIFDSILFLFSKETYRSTTNRNLTFQKIDNFDDRFDSFWQKCIYRYPIIGERNSDILNWRFGKCKYFDYKIFTLVHKQSNEIYGYIVYKIDGTKLIIADLLIEDIDQYGDDLMVLFLKFVRTLKVESIVFSFLGPDKLKALLNKYSFLKRPDERAFVVCLNKNQHQSELLHDAGKWYFMECDVD